MSNRIKKGDLVLVLKGKDKGKKGKVLKLLRDKEYLLIEKINLVKRHQRPSQKSQGGIIEKPGSVHTAKVALVCPRCNAPTRVNYKEVENDKKVRVCKRCKEFIDKV